MTRTRWTPRQRPLLSRIAGGIALLALAAAPVAAQSQPPIADTAWQQIRAIYQDKATWTRSERKIGSKLLYEIKRRRGEPLLKALPQLRSTLRLEKDGAVLVDVKAAVSDRLLERIAALGGAVVGSFPQHGYVQALLPLDQVETLALEEAVRSIRPSLGFLTQKVNTSQGDVTHAADVTRALQGVDGSGVTVGVISDGVDSLASLQTSGDLPGSVTVLPGQGGSGDEGSAMLEIVHDLAPGATLLFATAFSSEAQMAQNILDLRAAGADVIVDDIFYFAEGAFQDDVIAQAVETVTAGGAVYFSSAGNSGNLNDGTSGVWEGDFVATPAPPVVGAFDAHDFGGGMNYDTITADSPSLFILQWSDALGASANDYDLLLLNNARTTILDVSANTQDGNDDPIEAIDSTMFNDTGRTLVIVRFAGASRYLQLNTNRGRLAVRTDGQITGHAAAAAAFAVAAVNVATTGNPVAPFTGGPANPVEFFSSDGPRKVFYLSDGTPITPGNFLASGGSERPKPDVAAADGVATAAPGFNPFFGTSAAAPHAAAVAALMLEANPSLRRDSFALLFGTSALDIEAAGFDRDSGAGIVMADSGVSAAIDYIDIFADGFESGNTSSWSVTVP